jgi:hypothetical protein
VAESEGSRREELYRHWYAWVTTNLGHDGKLATIAADAATNAAIHGGGFNAAAQTARDAWVEARNADTRPSKRGHALRNVGLGCAALLVLAIIAAILVLMHSSGGSGVFCIGPTGDLC